MMSLREQEDLVLKYTKRNLVKKGSEIRGKSLII